MAEELTKEEKARIKEERRKAFLASHPELAAKQMEAEAKKKDAKKKHPMTQVTYEEVTVPNTPQMKVQFITVPTMQYM